MTDHDEAQRVHGEHLLLLRERLARLGLGQDAVVDLGRRHQPVRHN